MTNINCTKKYLASKNIMNKIQNKFKVMFVYNFSDNFETSSIAL